MKDSTTISAVIFVIVWLVFIFTLPFDSHPTYNRTAEYCGTSC